MVTLYELADAVYPVLSQDFTVSTETFYAMIPVAIISGVLGGILPNPLHFRRERPASQGATSDLERRVDE